MTRVSPTRRAVMRAAYLILNGYFTVYHRWRREGVEHIPRHGPLLVVINHVSVLDTIAVGAALIGRGFVPGATLWVAVKEELYENRFLAWLLPQVGMFRLDRRRVDLAAMRTMLRVLKEGNALGLAPEGTRSPTGHLLPFQPSVAKLAINLRAPILPVGVIGTEKALPRGTRIPRPVPITIRFGKVFELDQFYHVQLSDPELERAADEMRAHVATLLPLWMRELPRSTSPVHDREL